MSDRAVEAPVADWVRIPDLHRDPFPTFERLRAEGGVHWVPAVNRYLVTSYAAVHDTELDQETFSANEEGSLMIRAMGHSMLRRDDPDHYVERKAWQPVLRPGVVKKTWMPIFERNAERYLEEFLEKGPGADLVWDFAAPYVSENLRAIIGLHNATEADLQRWSQTMIDATGNYADDPAVWAEGERSFNEVDEALDEMLVWHSEHPDDSLVSALLRLPDYQMPLAAIRANVKMTIGGGLNEPRDAIGVAAWGLLTHPDQRELVTSGTASWDAVFDETIRWVAPIGMYSRQTTREVALQGVRLPAGAKLGICLLSANRDDTVYRSPDAFNVNRQGEAPHLAFGKGVHVCLGAWVARAEVAAVALPKLFSRLPDLTTVPHDPPQVRGWVFRGMTRLPVSWAPAEGAGVGGGAGTVDAPRVAIVGAGPSGCYTAQALRRAFPEAELSVIDQLPTPYGLVRSGVAPDHQGTKAVSQQFARLFETEGVRFVGSVNLGTDLTLDELRSAFDVVVLATGLHRDATLDVPGADLAGVHGAGRITRLLNAHPTEARPVPRLGRSVAVVGHGNVAMDLVRLLVKQPEHLADSDVDDEAHEQLAGQVEVVHAIGRSLPASAKFDPVMLREIADLADVEHVVHGVEEDDLARGDDPRSQLVRQLARSSTPGASRRVEWWFGYVPKQIVGESSVSAIALSGTGGRDDATIAVDSVVTAIGFAADPTQQHVVVDEEAEATGRVEPGLYVAGWARRGPRGTIASQRSDARELAEAIAADFAAPSHKPGYRAIKGALARSTTYDGWLLIDAHEVKQAAEQRIRRKLIDIDRLRLIAGSAINLPPAARGPRASARSEGGGGERVRILYATESGNGELVAEELAAHLSEGFDVEVVDLTGAGANVLDPQAFTVLICSTYGDGELPTSARQLHAELLAERPDLSALRYAVFGLGDRSYAHTYSRGSEILDETLRSLGARRVGEYGRHDAGGQELAPALAVQWVQRILPEIASSNVMAH